MELFGTPLITLIPEVVNGQHLYRSIGYILPDALPSKERTSFTLHTVNKSGIRCSQCEKPSCRGCLVRMGDHVCIEHDSTCLVVHFDDINKDSKRLFGIPNDVANGSRNSQGTK